MMKCKNWIFYIMKARLDSKKGFETVEFTVLAIGGRVILGIYGVSQ